MAGVSGAEGVLQCCEKLSSEFQEFYGLHDISSVDGPPTPIEFARDWFAPNKPAIFRNAVKHWPAMKKWNFSYLRSVMGKEVVTVAVTPNGYADAVNSGFFVMPEERKVTFENFLDILENNSSSGVYYIQKQNSNMTDEIKHLIHDVDSQIYWASEAFGKLPDAVNFWMGDKRAVTSMHRDHYENIYCVIRGQKEFILLPPTDLPWVPYDLYPSAVYKETDGHFEIVEVGDKVPWISVDPLNPDFEKYPLYKKASPIRCVVNEGDALYLPSLWFHHVQQSHGCIAGQLIVISAQHGTLILIPLNILGINWITGCVPEWNARNYLLAYLAHVLMAEQKAIL